MVELNSRNAQNSGDSKLSPSSKNPINVSVIIPYYQNDGNLLARAVNSVFTQNNGLEIEIIIVDDESPFPASEALKAVSPPENVTIKVQKQTNQGAAKARNTGLDLVGETTDYVAFLDSDDYWTPSHLALAVNGLQSNYDFYFSSRIVEDEKQDLFTKFDVANHYLASRITINEQAYWTVKQDFMMAIIRGFVVTSSVVYRFSPFKELRFPTTFFRFGEDQYFFMLIAKRTDRILANESIGSTYGSGVSIYSQQNFSSAKDFLRIQDEIRFRKKAINEIGLGNLEKTALKNRLIDARKALTAIALDRAKEKEFIFLYKMVTTDPLTFYYFIVSSLKKIIKSSRSQIRRFHI